MPPKVGGGSAKIQGILGRFDDNPVNWNQHASTHTEGTVE